MQLILILIAGLVETVSSVLGQTAFTKIITGPPVSEAAHSLASAWVDFDADGDLDLFVGNPDGPNLLYRNDGQSVFTKLTDGPIIDAGPGSFSASWVDMDNDGRLDLYLARNPGPSLLFVQEAPGEFTTTTLPMSTITGTAWSDYDGDGFVDLLSADRSVGMLWRNDGMGGLYQVTDDPIDVPGVGVTTWADYDGDGDMDALVIAGAFSGGTVNRLFRNEGAGIFTPITNGLIAQQHAPFTGVAWGDYNNDGSLDVFLPRGVAGRAVASFLFRNNRDGTFAQESQSPVTMDTGYALAGSWADYDNDGWLDLFIPDDGGSKNRLYHNNGDGTFSRVISGPIVSDGGNSANGSWGDYDRNGFLDLFVPNSNSGNGGTQPKDYLYRNDGNNNAWITIKCIGTRSNRSAIGAKVRVKAVIGGKTFWQLREISTGNGWNQNALEAHFGLGDATNVLTLRIEWPSGTVQEFENVPAKQYKTLTEPARLVAASPKNPFQFMLQGGRAMQYEIQTSTNLEAWSTMDTITITNLDGTAMITDMNAPNSGGRFYRAMLR